MDPNAPLHNIRNAYIQLLQRVNVALRTQVGDATRLRSVRSQALALRAAAEQVRFLYLSPPRDSQVLPSSIVIYSPLLSSTR